VIPHYDTPDESELNAMDDGQWRLLQQMLAARQQSGSPWGSSFDKQPKGPEAQAHSPSLMDIGRGALNAVGGTLGYDDLAKRTGETADLLSVPLMFSSMMSPPAAAARGAGPAWDAAMAKVLNNKYPDEKVITGGNPMGSSGNWFGVGGESYWNSSRGLAREHEIPRASRTNGMSWDPSAPALNDKPAVSGDGLRYLNELLAQQQRASFRPVGR
jgi:hypothetical protein